MGSFSGDGYERGLFQAILFVRGIFQSCGTVRGGEGLIEPGYLPLVFGGIKKSMREVRGKMYRWPEEGRVQPVEPSRHSILL